LPEAKKLLETSLHPDPDPLREQHGLFHSPAKVQGAACKGNKQKLFHSTPEKAGNDFLHAVGFQALHQRCLKFIADIYYYEIPGWVIYYKVNLVNVHAMDTHI